MTTGRGSAVQAKSVVADVSLPAEEFELGHLLEVRQGVRVRFESMIPTGEMIPYCWVRDPDVDAVADALRESPLVADVRILDRVGDETLFRIDWTEDVDGLVGALDDSDAVVLEGEGHGDRWSFRLRFAESDAFWEFYRGVLEEGFSLDLVGIGDSTDSTRPGHARLTDDQREALHLAFEAGYFSVPREITLVELAEELGISDVAASQRIRRGLSRVLPAFIGR